MQSLNLTDETFDVNQSGNYLLFMQSSLDGYSYAICDSVRKKCILLKHFNTGSHDWFDYNNSLKTILEGEEPLKLSYKSVHHILNRKEFTIVPEAFLPQNEQEFQLYYPDSINPGEILIKSAIDVSKSTVICPYPNFLADTLQRNIKNIKLSHHSLPFITYLIGESSRTLRHVFHMMIDNNYITIGVAHSGSLDFINSFQIQTTEDILYFLVSVLEKFRVSPSLAEVYSINNSSTADIHNKLQPYIGKVRNLKASQNMVYSYIFTEDILERFANMLNLYHCE